VGAGVVGAEVGAGVFTLPAWFGQQSAAHAHPVASDAAHIPSPQSSNESN
jgi:hypothetical protein